MGMQPRRDPLSCDYGMAANNSRSLDNILSAKTKVLSGKILAWLDAVTGHL